jgi:hypothetical protein
LPRVPFSWRIFLGVVVIAVVGSLIAGLLNEGDAEAIHAQYERDISAAFDELPLLPDMTVSRPKQGDSYRSRTGPTISVEAQYERPGTFTDTVTFFKGELARRGWAQTFETKGRIYFCKIPYQLQLFKSGLQDPRAHGFSLRLTWQTQQMDKTCG